MVEGREESVNDKQLLEEYQEYLERRRLRDIDIDDDADDNEEEKKNED